jgi:hypothetical protein
MPRKERYYRVWNLSGDLQDLTDEMEKELDSVIRLGYIVDHLSHTVDPESLTYHAIIVGTKAI